MRRRAPGAPSVLGSPVLIGALTALITIVAVFLAYNANSGLPFVPSYDLKAELPNAANLVVGNDVRVGGTRVGAVSDITVVRRNGAPVAVVDMKLEKSLDPLPKDSTIIVRPRSALGLKYVEITPGRSDEGYQAGSTIPVAQATPEAVEIDEVFNMFNEPTRKGSRQSLRGFGDALASRGTDLNTVIGELKPLLTHLRPVAENLSDPRTGLARFFRALGRTAAEVAPVGEQQGELFVNLDTTFTALAQVARPFIQETISKQVPTLETAIEDLPQQEPFLENSAALSRELQPGFAVLPTAMPPLADAEVAGVKVLPKVPAFNKQVEDVLVALADWAENPAVPRGVRELTETVATLKPTLAFLTPVQTTCNYVTLWFRNISSLLSEGDTNGTWQRFIIIATPTGPNDEGHAASAPANGPTEENHLHSNSYPNTGSPGQTKECEAANEPYYVGKTTIGNVPGNQGTKTADQTATASGSGR